MKLSFHKTVDSASNFQRLQRYLPGGRVFSGVMESTNVRSFKNNMMTLLSLLMSQAGVDLLQD